MGTAGGGGTDACQHFELVTVQLIGWASFSKNGGPTSSLVLQSQENLFKAFIERYKSFIHYEYLCQQL